MGKDYKSSRRDEKDHGGRDRREDVDERDKEKNRDKDRERDKIRDKDRERDKIRDKDRVKDKDHGRERDIEKEHHERGREGKDRDRDRDADRDKERVRGKERDREKHKDREREKEKEKDKDRDKTMREKVKGKDRDKDITDHEGKERSRDRDRDKLSVRNRDEGNDRVKDSRKDEKGIHGEGDVNTIERKQKSEGASDGLQTSTSQIKERILEMKEERLKKKSENVSEVLAWVNKSRKIEEKISSEKEKSLHRLKVLEEQDNIGQDESEDEGLTQHISKDLAGVKVLHGLDKVIEGGAVVLTLKDQSILADGDINEEIDMLENVEIGEQKQRDEAYRAAKKKTGIYTDKFNDDPFAEKKMLPQYDDPAEDEGITLDESGRFTGEAERKLEELRRRLEGSSTSSRFEDLNSTGKMTSDYYTSEEMLQFKKPKKKKSLRKKDKLDLDALEAEAISAGLGVADLGSRKDTKMQSVNEEQVRSDAQKRSDAYQSALAKAEEASKALRQEQFPVAPVNEDDNPIFGDDDEDLHRSLERARKLALKEQTETVTSVPQAVAALAIAKSTDVQVPTAGVTQEDKVVFTEMDEFVWGLQHDEETQKPEAEDVFMEDEEIPRAAVEEVKDDTGGWTEVNDANKDENLVNEKKEDIAPDETIHEVAVGKGLSGALQLLKERGTLKETVEWGGRNMDKKKSKLVGIYENDGSKEIQIERRDEFGRIMTPKEAFRMISHKFHGKGPGKMKQEKRMKQYQEEMKLKKMKNSDTPSESTERMREAQARMKTPYLVLSGHVKPGQTSDPRMGFSTAEDLPGGLTPMLGDRKVEHFLGIKRKADNSSMGPPAKKPTT